MWKLRSEWKEEETFLSLKRGLMAPLGWENENVGICGRMVSEKSVTSIYRSNMSSSEAEKFEAKDLGKEGRGWIQMGHHGKESLRSVRIARIQINQHFL